MMGELLGEDTGPRLPLHKRIAQEIEMMAWAQWTVRGPEQFTDAVIEFMVKDRQTGEEAMIKVIMTPRPPYR